MAHHKRRRPKSRRAGCLMCKPHKRQGVDRYRQQSKSGGPVLQEQRARTNEREQRIEAAA